MNLLDFTIVPPWFEPQLGGLLSLGDRVPHALLVHGQAGVGKRAFAALVARGLLCESDDAAARVRGGCGGCLACGWFARGNHPDFRRLTSAAIVADEGGADYDLEADDGETAQGKKKPSRQIVLKQALALQRFLAVATHRAGRRVVLLHPLEAVNTEAANAMLKMLEEPPPATVFLLVADRLGGVPATILSRCRKVAIAPPPASVAREWLAAEGLDDDGTALALAGGAPFAALALAADADALNAQRDLVRFLAAPDPSSAMAAAEAFSRAGAPAPIVHWMQLWLADCLSARLAERVRYHPAHSATLARLAQRASLEALVALMQRLLATRRTVEHPLNVRLMLEGLFCAYADAVAPAHGASGGMVRR